MTKIVFPEDFLFGVATSAAQIEGGALDGGRTESIWDEFSKKQGVIADGTNPTIACDSYNKLERDIALLKELGATTYRFSFSWSRILPKGTGEINQMGLDYYHKLVRLLLDNDIVPNATLYHWDLPQALQEQGGFLNSKISDWFAEYASILFKEFGEFIPLWSTFNEPIATYVGYGQGFFAPGIKGEQSGRQANHNLLLAHGKAVSVFRKEKKAVGKIGIVVDIWNHLPFRENNKEDQELANLENAKSYRFYLDPIFRGDYSRLLKEWMISEDCLPDIQDVDMDIIKAPLDFFGLNCYNIVYECVDKKLMDNPDLQKAKGGNFLENNAVYYPKAIYDALMILKDEYKLDIPIYITENGTGNCNEEVTSTNEIHDEKRIKYVRDFLNWIHQAIEEGCDVRGYYLWSLMDNWEWSAGYTQRFGIYYTNFTTQECIPKDSAHWYRKVIKERGFSIL